MELLAFIALALAFGGGRGAGTKSARRHPVTESDYKARLARLTASIPALVARTRKAMADWPTWLNRYRGGMSLGFFASVPSIESHWQMAAPGDPSLGEVGWYQITKEFPASIGVDPAKRYQREWNMALGGIEYNMYAGEWAKRLPGVDVVDMWMLARLSFAIGDGGARALVRSWAQDHPNEHFTYDSLSRWVGMRAPASAGSQSREKVAYRVHVVEVNFEVARQADPDGVFGEPAVVPRPQG